jgi:hypothetical protein
LFSIIIHNHDSTVTKNKKKFNIEKFKIIGGLNDKNKDCFIFYNKINEKFDDYDNLKLIQGTCNNIQNEIIILMKSKIIIFVLT